MKFTNPLGNCRNSAVMKQAFKIRLFDTALKIYVRWSFEFLACVVTKPAVSRWVPFSLYLSFGQAKERLNNAFRFFVIMLNNFTIKGRRFFTAFRMTKKQVILHYEV